MKLRRLLEQQDASAQYYDLGKDFSSFTHMMDGAEEQVKTRFEQAIASKLKGKKIRARASRGYKQFEKDYEIDVANVSIDDYYDNYVVVVKASNGKEYFLKPGFKVQILGAMEPEKPKQAVPQTLPPQSQPAQQAPPSQTPTAQPQQQPVKESVHKYAISEIEKDIAPWLSKILVNPAAISRNYILREGVCKGSMASFRVTIPVDDVPALTMEQIREVLSESANSKTIYTLDKFDIRGDNYILVIQKTSK